MTRTEQEGGELPGTEFLGVLGAGSKVRCRHWLKSFSSYSCHLCGPWS